MEAHEIDIGKKMSAVIAIDPLRDFGTEEGVFVQCYGAEDAKPVIETIIRLKRSLRSVQDKARMILCRSEYQSDQFGIEKLEELCTSASGRESLIQPDWFESEFNKTDNSIFASDINVEEMLSSLHHLILCGVTTTSCIAKSLAEIRERVKGLTIIIPRVHVASRVSRQAEEKVLLDHWSKPSEQKIIIVPSLEAIGFM